jgi:hypothetical protein
MQAAMSHATQPLVTRAVMAYCRDEFFPQPCQHSSGVEQVDGRSYVVLRNVNGVLAAYRVRTCGRLKRLRRLPAALA